MEANEKGPAVETGEAKSPQKEAQSLNPTTNGLLRLHQQACRLAVNAIHRDDKRMADGFKAVILSLEWALNRKGVLV